MQESVAFTAVLMERCHFNTNSQCTQVTMAGNKMVLLQSGSDLSQFNDFEMELRSNEDCASCSDHTMWSWDSVFSKNDMYFLSSVIPV